ncbi:MAG: glycosyltransferase family protein, partial [Planctomycetota bacterium]
MRITYLLETAEQLWGGVKSVLEVAGELQRRGHQVTILSKSGPPTWMDLGCEFRQVPDFSRDHVPAADLLIATFWTTLPAAIESGRGLPVHYCQGYEAAGVENPALAERIRRIYALPGSAKITISPHLAAIIAGFGHQVHEVTYAVDHQVMFPSRERAAYEPIRVGLVGPYEIPWKDIETGIEACRLAAEAGLRIELVRITNTQAHPDELSLRFPVDLHQRVPPAQMGELYRSLDVL